MAITPEKKKQTTTKTTTPKPESVTESVTETSSDSSALETPTSPSPEGESHLSGLAKDDQTSNPTDSTAASSEHQQDRSSRDSPATSQEMRVPGNLSDPQEGPLEATRLENSSRGSFASLNEKPDQESDSPSTAPGFVPRSVVASSDPDALADFLTVQRESGDPLEADRAMQELMAAARANPQLVNAAVTRAEELDRKAENQAIMERRRVAEHNMLNQGIDAHYASELDRRRATEGF